MKILLHVIATNKYTQFLEGIIESSDSFLFKQSDLDIIVHTNMDISDIKERYAEGRIGIFNNHIDHEQWPYTTLKRFHYFLSSIDVVRKYDYSFYVDVDSIFSGEINEDILPNEGMIGTIHPCLFEGNGTPDRNPMSTAYIKPGSDNRYFCGGFFGGSTDYFIKACEELKTSIDADISKSIMAVWHDESHLNRYFFENPPSVVLDNHFGAAEEHMHLYPNAKVCFLDKSRRGGHTFFRN